MAASQRPDSIMIGKDRYDLSLCNPAKYRESQVWGSFSDEVKTKLLSHYFQHDKASVDVAYHNGFFDFLLHISLLHDHSSSIQCIMDNSVPTWFENYSDYLGTAAWYLSVNTLKMLLIRIRSLYYDAKINWILNYNPPLSQGNPLYSTYKTRGDFIKKRQIIEMLLEAGTNPEKPGNDGKTLLQFALSDPNLMRILLQYKNMKYKTALENMQSTNPVDQKKEYKKEELECIALLKNVPLTAEAFAAVPAQPIPDYKRIYPDQAVISQYPKKLEAKERDDKHHPGMTPAMQLQERQKPFQNQFFELIDKLNVWGQNVNFDNVTLLKSRIFDHSNYTQNQSSEYFEYIKQRLEQIYLHLHNEKIPLSDRQRIYAEMINSYAVCSPGLFNHIDHAFQQLDGFVNISIKHWLAEFRTNLIHNEAERIHNLKFPAAKDKDSKNPEQREGNYTHTLNGLLLCAANKGWNPLTDTKANADVFTTMSNLTAEDYQTCMDTIDKNYHPSSIADFIQNKLRYLIDAKVGTEGFKTDANGWIVYSQAYHDWLSNIIKSLFGPEANLFDFFEFESLRGDPQRAYIQTRVNQDVLYKQIMDHAIKNKIFSSSVLESQSIKLKSRFYLISRYFPIPQDITKDTQQLDHWLSLPDADLCELIQYWIEHGLTEYLDAWIKSIKPVTDEKNIPENPKLPDFLESLLKHTHQNRKSKSLECLIDKVLSPLRDRLIKEKKLAPDNLIGNIAYKKSKRNNQYYLVNNFGAETPYNALSDEDTENLIEIIIDSYKQINKTVPTINIHIWFLHAAKTNKSKTFAFLAKNYRANMSTDLIHTAATNGSLQVVDVLLQPEYKIDVNARLTTNHNYNAAHFAARRNKPETLTTLLRNGADATSALAHAADGCAPDAVDALVHWLEKTKFANDEKGRIAFLNQRFIKNNLPAKLANDKKAFSAIDQACLKDQGEIIKKLARAGASMDGILVRSIKQKKHNALKAAIYCKGEINQRLPEPIYGLLRLAIQERNPEALDLLIISGTKFNEDDDKHTSLLSYVIAEYYKYPGNEQLQSCLRVVLHHKIDLDKKVVSTSKDQAADYAIFSAIANADVFLFDALVTAGASLTLRLGPSGLLPIHAVILRLVHAKSDALPQRRMLRTLLNQSNYKDYLDQEDSNGNAAINLLDDFSKYDQIDALLMLTQTSTNLNHEVKSCGNMTPLATAIDNCNLVAVRSLLFNRDNLDLDTPGNKKALQTLKAKLATDEKEITPKQKSNLTKILNLLESRSLTSKAFAIDNSSFVVDNLTLMRTALINQYSAKIYADKNDAVKENDLRKTAYSFGWNPLINNEIPLGNSFPEEVIDGLFDHLEANYTVRSIATFLNGQIWASIAEYFEQCKRNNTKPDIAAYAKNTFDIPFDTNIYIQNSSTGDLVVNYNYLMGCIVDHLCHLKIFHPQHVKSEYVTLKTMVFFASDFIPVEIMFTNWKILPEDIILELLGYVMQLPAYDFKNDDKKRAQFKTQFLEPLGLFAASSGKGKLVSILIQDCGLNYSQWITAAAQAARNNQHPTLARELENLTGKNSAAQPGLFAHSALPANTASSATAADKPAPTGPSGPP